MFALFLAVLLVIREQKWTLAQIRWVLQTEIYRHHVICAKNLDVRSVSCCTTGHRGVEMNSGSNQVSVTNRNIQTSCNMCKESCCSHWFLPCYWSSGAWNWTLAQTRWMSKQKYTDIMWYVQRILFLAVVQAAGSCSAAGHWRSRNKPWSKRKLLKRNNPRTEFPNLKLFGDQNSYGTAQCMNESERNRWSR